MLRISSNFSSFKNPPYKEVNLLIDNSDTLFAKYQSPPTSDEIDPSCFANCFGLQTRADLFHTTAEYAGKLIPGFPIPDDRVYGGQAEYTGLLTAIDERASQDRFVAVELGAAWGPWVALAGVVAKRAGVKDMTLIAVEASEQKISTLSDHLARNGLVGQAGIDTRVVHGAAWSEDTTLHFPAEMPITDYGGAASSSDSNNDYRGFVYETVPVTAYSLETLCQGLERVDYMHWDLQGAEREVALASGDFLNGKVKHLYIGTHSRAIEGVLMEKFFAMKWELLWQQPCSFTYDASKPSLEGMTTTDGEMLWVNPHI